MYSKITNKSILVKGKELNAKHKKTNSEQDFVLNTAKQILKEYENAFKVLGE